MSGINVRSLTSKAGVMGAVLAMLLSAASAHAQVRFVNLSNQDVFVARYDYQPSVPFGGGPFGDNPGSPEGWNFNGWWKVEPGAEWQGDAGNYYVQNNAGRVSWAGLSESPGFVTDAAFNVFVSKDGWDQDAKKWLKKGYRQVQFEQFADGLYTISGDAYRLREKTFNFDFSSRDVNFHNRDFVVPGRVAWYDSSADSWNASGVAWDSRDNKVWVSLSTEGQQKRPFGPREPGYYRGQVTVHYTEKR